MRTIQTKDLCNTLIVVWWSVWKVCTKSAELVRITDYEERQHRGHRFPKHCCVKLDFVILIIILSVTYALLINSSGHITLRNFDLLLGVYYCAPSSLPILNSFMASLTNHRRGNQRQQIAFVGFEHYSTIRFFFSFTMLSLGTKKKSRELVEKESDMELIGKTHQQK